MNRRLGVCYYPELYPEDKRALFVKEDIQLMRKAGFSVVRMAEFCWCLMEPREGEYAFDWLEETVNTLGEQGIYTVLCTPTAAHPVWMAEKYPQTLYVDNFGVRRSYGGRHYHCYNDPAFRSFTAGICRALGERFGKHPYVIGFQVDNDMGQEHSGRCCCPTCQKLFREELKREFHQDIDRLNDAFGTLFWGQRFDTFEQIHAPAVSTLPHDPKHNFGWMGTNMPSLRLAYERFCSDSIVAYFKLQADVLRGYTDKPITHNTTHFATCKVKYYDMAAHMDVAGVDHYPDALSQDKQQSGMIYSMVRNYQKKDFWLLETLCGGGHGNWAYQGMPHCPPGAFRQNIAYAYVSGAELITAFKYMVFPSGFEQLGSALVDLDRIPGRRYEEFRAAGMDLKALEPLLEKTTLDAEVAIVVDYDSLWFHQIKPIHKEFTYEKYIQILYGQLTGLGMNVDIIGSQAPLDGYKAVFVPFAPVLPDSFKAVCRRYVAGGGNLFAMCMTFSCNRFGSGEFRRMPLGMDDFFGIRVKEVEPVFRGRTDAVVRVGELSVGSDVWQETLECYDAEVIGVFDNTYRKALPVMTAKKNGSGYAYYLGTVPDPGTAGQFFGWLCGACGVSRAPIETLAGVDIVTRRGEARTYYFVFNSADEERSVGLRAAVRDMCEETEITDRLTIEARGIRIVFVENGGDAI